ncbi:MAG: hypothetical protein VX874_18660 [Pseudomonadota bacterium]|nr:hypothetical protein [Pseudomonadota bacterium]
MRWMMTGLMALMAAPAVALDTRFGEVDIAPLGEMEKGLMFQGEVIELPSNPYYAFVEAALHDWLLVSVSQGGNACATEYVWAKLSEEGVGFSEVFGTCAEGFEMTEVPAGAKVTIPSAEVGAGPVSFIYDGETISEVQEGPEPIGWTVGEPGAFWLDRYAFDFFGAGELQGHLANMMPPDMIALAEKNAELGGPFEMQGGWVVARACEKLACETNFVVVAISDDGSRMLVGVDNEAMQPVVYGDTEGALPAAIEEIGAE